MKSTTTVVGLGHNTRDVRRLWRSYLVALFNALSSVLKPKVFYMFAVVFRWNYSNRWNLSAFFLQ